MYRMVPKEEHFYQGVAKMLLHFRWNWIGLITPLSENGERFIRSFVPVLVQNAICPVFIYRSPVLTEERISFEFEVFRLWNEVSVLIYYGEYRFFYGTIWLMQAIIEKFIKPIVSKVWVTTALWDLSLNLDLEILLAPQTHSFFSFLIHRKKEVNYEATRAVLRVLRHFHTNAFNCLYSRHGLSRRGRIRCQEKENLESPPKELIEKNLSLDSYNIHSILQALAHSLNAAHLSRSRQKTTVHNGRQAPLRIQSWQVLVFPSHLLPKK